MAFNPATMAAGRLSAVWMLRMARWQATNEEEQAVLVGIQGPAETCRRRGSNVMSLMHLRVRLFEFLER